MSSRSFGTVREPRMLLSAFVPSYADHVQSCPGEGEGGRALHSPVPYKEFALENTQSPVSLSLSTEFTLQSYHHANNCG